MRSVRGTAPCCEGLCGVTRVGGKPLGCFQDTHAVNVPFEAATSARGTNSRNSNALHRCFEPTAVCVSGEHLKYIHTHSGNKKRNPGVLVPDCNAAYLVAADSIGHGVKVIQALIAIKAFVHDQKGPCLFWNVTTSNMCEELSKETPSTSVISNSR